MLNRNRFRWTPSRPTRVPVWTTNRAASTSANSAPSNTTSARGFLVSWCIADILCAPRALPSCIIRTASAAPFVANWSRIWNRPSVSLSISISFTRSSKKTRFSLQRPSTLRTKMRTAWTISFANCIQTALNTFTARSTKLFSAASASSWNTQTKNASWSTCMRSSACGNSSSKTLSRIRIKLGSAISKSEVSCSRKRRCFEFKGRHV